MKNSVLLFFYKRNETSFRLRAIMYGKEIVNNPSYFYKICNNLPDRN